MVEVEVDQALGDFFEKLLNEYVYVWYREISYDEDFVQEIRLVLRHAVAILVKRLYRVDLTDLIVKKVIPIALCHLGRLLLQIPFEYFLRISFQYVVTYGIHIFFRRFNAC